MMGKFDYICRKMTNGFSIFFRGCKQSNLSTSYKLDANVGIIKIKPKICYKMIKLI